MTGRKISISAAALAFGTLLLGMAAAGRWAWAQEGEGQAAAQERPPAKDYYQRSLEIYEFRKAARQGQERGREIFYYKCWYCHNEFAKGAPQMAGLFSRPRLVSGQPVNDETVKDKIRKGGPGMPAFGTALQEDDLTDLVTFLREACCWNSESPPANPRFKMAE